VILLYSRYRNNREECLLCLVAEKMWGNEGFLVLWHMLILVPEMDALDPIHDFNRIFPFIFSAT
jgi:hypothetical protein